MLELLILLLSLGKEYGVVSRMFKTAMNAWRVSV